MPVYGIIIVTSIYLLQNVIKKREPPILSDEITVQDPKFFMTRKRKARQLEILDRIDVEPFIDILQEDVTELKQSAIKQLANIRSREAIKTLISTLHDEDIEVRLYAAGILGKLEDEYTKEIDAKGSHLQRNPENIKLRLDLAKSYISFTESELLDSISKSYYFDEAIRILAPLDQEESHYLEAKAFLGLSEYSKALKNILKCLNSSRNNPEYNLEYWKSIYALKDFQFLAQNIEKAKKANIEVNTEISDFWAG